MTHTKGQGQRSLGSKVEVETDGWADGIKEEIPLLPMVTRSVVNKIYHSQSADST